MDINRTILIGKKPDEKFTSTQTEHIISSDVLYQQGIEVFQDKEKLNRWLNAPNRALNGEIPNQLLGNQFRRKDVRNILCRIQWNVFNI